MTFGYPVFLELRGRRVVVIGETAVRSGRVEALLAAGATEVVVITEGPASHLAELEAQPGSPVVVKRRGWRATDLDRAFLCVAASQDPEERDQIAREARARGVLVNVMDDVPNCDWSAPAIVRRNDLVIAISTGGASPALARALRERLEAEFGEEWSDVLGVLCAVRRETRDALPDVEERTRRWRAALDVDEAAALVADGRSDELRDRLVERLSRPAEVRT